MIATERDYVAVMSVVFLGVVLWHIVHKISTTLPGASHLTRLWPGIVNRHLARLSQEFDTRPHAFTEVLAKKLFTMQWVEQSPLGDAMYSHPSSQRFCSCSSVL